MGTVTVRAVALADLPEIVLLWYDKMVFQQQYDPRFKLMPDATAKWLSAAEGWLADSHYGIFGAERDGHLLGYVIGRMMAAPVGLMPEQLGCVVEMTIDSHSHEGGLGRLLLNALEDWFSKRDIHYIVACVPHRGAVEQAFWRANGAAEWVDLMWIR
jgi:GNAT superfamily N-acetyltransferase